MRSGESEIFSVRKKILNRVVFHPFIILSLCGCDSELRIEDFSGHRKKILSGDGSHPHALHSHSIVLGGLELIS